MRGNRAQCDSATSALPGTAFKTNGRVEGSWNPSVPWEECSYAE